MLRLDNADVSRLLTMDETMGALRKGFEDFSQSDAAFIPRHDLYSPTGDTDNYMQWGCMIGSSRSFGVVALRIKSDIITWEHSAHGNLTLEKYCGQIGQFCGLVYLFDMASALPLAMINDGVIQHLRVGGSAGIGTDHMARRDAKVLGLLGSGGMARVYAESIALVRDIQLINVFSPTESHRRSFANEMSERLGIECRAVADPESAVRGADIVASCTDSLEHTIDSNWIEAGSHLVFVSTKEISPAVIDRADRVLRLGGYGPDVVNGRGMGFGTSTVASYFAGQPEEIARLPRLDAENVPSIDTIGPRPQISPMYAYGARKIPMGRANNEEITIFVNGGLQGVQFAAAGGRMLQLAREHGAGDEMPDSWFLQAIRD